MKNSIQEGKSFDLTLAATVLAGDLLAIGQMVGVAYNGGVSGDSIAVSLCGVYEVPKATGAIAIGDRLYFDVSEGKVTTTGTGNIFAGFAWTAQLSGDTTVQIKLSQGDAAGETLQQADVVAAITGTLTGSTDGVIADVAPIALSTTNTYTDAAVNAAVNTAITSVNLQHKELMVKINEVIAELKEAGLMATS